MGQKVSTLREHHNVQTADEFSNDINMQQSIARDSPKSQPHAFTFNYFLKSKPKKSKDVNSQEENASPPPSQELVPALMEEPSIKEESINACSYTNEFYSLNSEEGDSPDQILNTTADGTDGMHLGSNSTMEMIQFTSDKLDNPMK